jgi:hypothetical protein
MLKTVKIILKIYDARFLPVAKGGREGFFVGNSRDCSGDEKERSRPFPTGLVNLHCPLFSKEGDLNHYDLSHLFFISGIFS